MLNVWRMLQWWSTLILTTPFVTEIKPLISCFLSFPFCPEGDASPRQPSGPAADPTAWGDPPAESGAGVPPSQGDAGRCHLRARGVRGRVRPAVRHPNEGRLCSVHASETPRPHQDEHQLQTFLTLLKRVKYSQHSNGCSHIPFLYLYKARHLSYFLFKGRMTSG